MKYNVKLFTFYRDLYEKYHVFPLYKDFKSIYGLFIISLVFKV